MTYQTVVVCLCLGMTIHTPLHRHLHRRFGRRFFTLSDVTMAGLTLHLSQHHMAAMREEDIVRLLVNPSPWNFLSHFLKLSDLFFIRMFGNGVLMTLHADGHFWHTREGLFLKMGVAGGALDALFLMFFMVERDGLFRSEA